MLLTLSLHNLAHLDEEVGVAAVVEEGAQAALLQPTHHILGVLGAARLGGERGGGLGFAGVGWGWCCCTRLPLWCSPPTQSIIPTTNLPPPHTTQTHAHHPYPPTLPPTCRCMAGGCPASLRRAGAPGRCRRRRHSPAQGNQTRGRITLTNFIRISSVQWGMWERRRRRHSPAWMS